MVCVQLENICLNITTKPHTGVFNIGKDIAFQCFAAPKLEVKNENLNEGVSSCSMLCATALYVQGRTCKSAKRTANNWRK